MLELSEAARDHFERPRHAGTLDSSQPQVVEALVGEPVSGDILLLQMCISPTDRIEAVGFKAYGCGWLIACASLLAESVHDQPLEQVRDFRHHSLVEALTVPPAKLHCAVLAETALKAALRALAVKRTPLAVTQSSPSS